VANFCTQCGHHLTGPYCSECGAAAEGTVASKVTTTTLPQNGGQPTITLPEESDASQQNEELARRAVVWFVWPFVAGRVLDFIAFGMLRGGVTAVFTIFYPVGAAINVGLACWLLHLAGRGSPVARWAFMGIWGVWGVGMGLFTLLGFVESPVPALFIDTVGVAIMLYGIARSILLLRQVKPPAHRMGMMTGTVTTVSLRTEMPSFVATILLLTVTVVQLGVTFAK
jgi:hypothetical protein